MHLICFFLFGHAAVTQPSSLLETLPPATKAAAPEKQPLPTEVVSKKQPLPTDVVSKKQPLPTEVVSKKQPLPTEEVGKMLKWLVKISNRKNISTQFLFIPIQLLLLLPEGWKQTLPKEQHLWVSKALFTRHKSGKLAQTKNLRLWWFPPGPRPLYVQPPSSPDVFFHAKLFLWFPYRMWVYRLLCTQPTCHRLCIQLIACGMYKTERQVLNVSGCYFMGTEYLECRSCKKKLAAWSRDILDQLDPVHREKFPAVLTYRLADFLLRFEHEKRVLQIYRFKLIHIYLHTAFYNINNFKAVVKTMHVPTLQFRVKCC